MQNYGLNCYITTIWNVFFISGYFSPFSYNIYSHNVLFNTIQIPILNIIKYHHNWNYQNSIQKSNILQRYNQIFFSKCHFLSSFYLFNMSSMNWNNKHSKIKISFCTLDYGSNGERGLGRTALNNPLPYHIFKQILKCTQIILS